MTSVLLLFRFAAFTFLLRSIRLRSLFWRLRFDFTFPRCSSITFHTFPRLSRSDFVSRSPVHTGAVRYLVGVHVLRSSVSLRCDFWVRPIRYVVHLRSLIWWCSLSLIDVLLLLRFVDTLLIVVDRLTTIDRSYHVVMMMLMTFQYVTQLRCLIVDLLHSLRYISFHDCYILTLRFHVWSFIVSVYDLLVIDHSCSLSTTMFIHVVHVGWWSVHVLHRFRSRSFFVRFRYTLISHVSLRSLLMRFQSIPDTFADALPRSLHVCSTTFTGRYHFHSVMFLFTFTLVPQTSVEYGTLLPIPTVGTTSLYIDPGVHVSLRYHSRFLRWSLPPPFVLISFRLLPFTIPPLRCWPTLPFISFVTIPPHGGYVLYSYRPILESHARRRYCSLRCVPRLHISPHHTFDGWAMRLFLNRWAVIWVRCSAFLTFLNRFLTLPTWVTLYLVTHRLCRYRSFRCSFDFLDRFATLDAFTVSSQIPHYTRRNFLTFVSHILISFTTHIPRAIPFHIPPPLLDLSSPFDHGGPTTSFGWWLHSLISSGPVHTEGTFDATVGLHSWSFDLVHASFYTFPFDILSSPLPSTFSDVGISTD